MVRYASQAPPAPLPEPRLPPLLVRALQRRRPDHRRDRARLEPRAHARRHGGPPLHGRRLRGLARLPAPGPDLLRPPGQDDQDHGRPRRHERGHRRVPASATAVVPRARSFSLAGTAPGRAEVQIKELGFHFIDPLAPIAEKEIVPRVRVFIPYLGIEGWISITSRGPASFSTRRELRSTRQEPRPTRPWDATGWTTATSSSSSSTSRPCTSRTACSRSAATRSTCSSSRTGSGARPPARPSRRRARTSSRSAPASANPRRRERVVSVNCDICGPGGAG